MRRTRPIVHRAATARMIAAVALAALATLASTFVPGRLVAQRPLASGPDSLPPELVEGLLKASVPFYGGMVEFFVGQVPPAVQPFLYVPPRARVLGGMTTNGGAAVVLSLMGTTVDQLRTEYGREVPKFGWALPPNAESFRGWGFMPAPNTGPTGSGLEFCHAGQTLEIVPLPGVAGAMTVTATIQSQPGPCSMVTRPGGRPPAPSRLPMPTIENPVGTVMDDRSCNIPAAQPVGFNGASERALTSLSAVQLLDDFGKQLADSGWSTNAAAMAVGRTWVKPDTGGYVRELTITISPIEKTRCQQASMNLREVRAPR